MSDLSMTEISKGVWVPRGTPFARTVVKVPEEDDCRCMMPGYKCGECRAEERAEAAAAGGGTSWPKEQECQWGSGCILSALKHTHPAGLSAASVAVLNPAGLPRRAAGVMNPEDESDDEEDAMRRPLEPVAANTYEQARKMAEKAEADAAYRAIADKVAADARATATAAAAAEQKRQEEEARAAAAALAAEDARWAAAEAEEDARRKEEARVAAGKTWAADGGAVNGLGKDSHYYKEKYTETLWENAPERERPEPFAASWYSCVERWHFVQLGGLCRHRIIIEVELHGGTSLRHILYLDQIKGVLTKSNNREHGEYKVMEEVIIDMRRTSNSFSPEQVKFKFMGSANAMAFHLALTAALDRSF